MRLLLDSHTLLWAVDDPGRLGSIAIAKLQDPSNEVLLSAATIWEISIKVGLGKPSLSKPYREWMLQATADLGATVLPITIQYADIQATLPSHHRDPFDRLLVAQARIENVPVVSNDLIFDQYGVSRVW